MARNGGPQRILKVGILCLFIVFGLCGFAEAENKTTTQQGNVFTLGQIEVSGETEEMANVTVDKITADEMQEFSTDRLPDALNLLPGVTLSGTKFRNEQTVYIRGFGPSRVPVFLDGVPIYVPNDRTFDFNRFTTFDLSEIVVSKGFTSVLYGPNAMGGAINMVTRKPEKPFEGNAGVGYGTGNTYYGYANLGTNQKKWYLQGGASYYNRDTYPMSNNYDPTIRQGGGNRIESYSRDNKVNFKIGLTPAKGHEYAFSYIKQHGDKGGPPDTRPNGDTKFWLWPRWDKESLYLTTRTPLGDKSYAKVRLYYDKFVNTLATYTDNTYSEFNMKQGGKSYYNDWTVGGSVEAGTTIIPRNNIKATFHYKRDTHNERNLFGKTTVKNVYAPEPWQRYDDLTMSAGIEDTINFTKKLYAIAGVSYDRAKGLRATEWDPSSVAGGWYTFPTDTVSTWNPQFGLFYLLSDTGKLHASVAKKTAFPSMKDKFSGGLGTKLANPGLGPEKSINYEIGYEDVFIKRIRVKSTVFYNDITDAIQSVTVGALTQNQNVGKVKQVGAEIGGTVSITKDLETGLNYTYINRKNDTDETEYIRLTDVPAHKFFGYTKYMTPLKGLSLLGSVEYESGRTTSTDGIWESRPFALVNFKATYKLRLIKGVTIEGRVDNVLDRYYEYTPGYPGPGRTYFANMRYEF